MTTEADKKKDKAVEHIRAAITALSEIIVGECQGHSDYNERYKGKLKTGLTTLINLRDELL